METIVSLSQCEPFAVRGTAAMRHVRHRLQSRAEVMKEWANGNARNEPELELHYNRML